jgi:hypothetical protein
MKAKPTSLPSELKSVPRVATRFPPELIVRKTGSEAQLPPPELLERPTWMPATGPPYCQFPPLETVTKSHLTTRELSYYTNMQPQSWRVKACYDTAPEGLRPLRVCGKLAWPTAGAKKLLGLA